MTRHLQRIDNRVSVETPEGVEYDLELAGISPRAGAWVVDFMIKTGVLWVGLLFVIPFGERLGMAIVLLVLFVTMWMYHPIFEIWKNGQTPGKMLFNVRVVNRDGTPVGWYGTIVRNLVRVVDLLPFGYVTGVMSMIISGRFQRLGDLAGDTLVVYHRGAYATRDLARLPEAEPVQIPVVLQPHEQEAIVDFAERAPMLGKARSAELASILTPISDASTGKSATRYLFGLAQRIVRWG